MRPKQWIKNLIVFLPLFFGHRIGDTEALLRLTILLITFCSASSAVYLFNDICDRAIDRLHPVKSRRPIASGAWSLSKAYILIALLVVLACAVILSLLSFPFAVYALISIVLYLLLNLFYSLKGKHIPIVDAFLVAFGFLIRLYAAGAVSGVPISHWLALMTLFLSLLLAFGKRKEDLRLLQETALSSRPVVKHYTDGFLNVLLAILSATIIILYTLYATDGEVISRNGPYLYVSVFPVATGLFHYLRHVIVKGCHCNPTDMLYQDHGLQLSVVVWIILYSISPYVA